MTDYQLFGTEGCHLCEEAGLLLAEQGIAFISQDIIERDDWLAAYRLLIPVLLHPPTGKQLNWPFDRNQLQNFIDSTAQPPA